MKRDDYPQWDDLNNIEHLTLIAECRRRHHQRNLGIEDGDGS
jgi:hypothetical protein